jgi:glycosyltransferase involved in cell wall biosynthesis
MKGFDRQDNLAIIIFSKNEIRNITSCIQSCENFPNVFVIDSSSTDGTQEAAKILNATVIDFQWNGTYPRKKQWSVDYFVGFEWLLLLDADERLTTNFMDEVFTIISNAKLAAAKTVIEYSFLGKTLKYGHRVTKVNLVRRKECFFPDLESNLMGNGDIEMHYQPIIKGRTVKLKNRILHEDEDPLVSWIRRHVLYAELEAELNLDLERRRKTLAQRSLGGKIFARFPLKPLLFFLYSYFIRLGFLDSKPGFLYSFYLSWYYSLIAAIESDKKRV